jgi:hypothetical protein
MAAAVLVAAGCGGGPPGAPASPGRDPADRGHELYSEGKLDAAQRELEGVVARHSKNTLARRILGRIYLLKGRHDEAARQFLSYVTLVRTEKIPVDAMTVQDLFWAFYRMDDYAQASKAAVMLDDSVLATKYAEMNQRGPPYTAEWRDDASALAFEEGNLLPLRVNGARGKFALDWGGGETVLDRDFAKEARVRIVGIPSPGIERDEQGFVERVELPGLHVRNVPVVVSRLGRSGAQQVDGVLGVGFLSHFQATIDPGRGRLVLRRAGLRTANLEAWPLLFAGDRTLLVPGKVDGLETWIIVNPSAAGVRFVPSQAMILEKARLSPQGPALERVDVGSMAVKIETQDPEKFPAGLDVGFGFTVGGMLGAGAFKSKVLTFDFKAMRLIVE